MVDESYQTTDRTGDRSGWVLVDPTTMTRLRDLLRVTAKEITRCWWCMRPLRNGLCEICDAESAS